MSQRTRAALKAFFETGDKPTQSQFGDFIDSAPNYSDNGAPISRVYFEYTNQATTGTSLEILTTTYVLPANSLAAVGDQVIIEGEGEIVANTNSKAIGLTFDGTNYPVVMDAAVSNRPYMNLLCRVTRINSNTVIIEVLARFGQPLASVGGSYMQLLRDTKVVDFSSTLDFDIAALTPSSAGDLTLDFWKVLTDIAA